MFRKTSLRGFANVPFLFLALLVTTLCITPRSAHSVRAQQMETPGYGSGQTGTPGIGDDDQPTVNPPPGRRTTVQMSEPDHGSSGSATPVQVRNLGTVRRLIVSSREFLRRFFAFVQ